MNKVVTEQMQVPDIEWWFRDHSNSQEAKKLSTMKGNGKFEIQKEVFFVVRSTLVIKDVNSADEGVYQCRASMSPERYANDVNLYQHWRIEEAPVKDPDCQDTNTTSHHQVEEMFDQLLDAVEEDKEGEGKDTVLTRLIQAITGNEDENSEYDVVDLPVSTTTTSNTEATEKGKKNTETKATTTSNYRLKTSLPTAKSKLNSISSSSQIKTEESNAKRITDEETKVVRQEDFRNSGSTTKTVFHSMMMCVVFLHVLTWILNV